MSLLEFDAVVLADVRRWRRGARSGRSERPRLVLRTDLVVVLPVFVLAKGAAVAGDAASGAGLVGLAAAVPAGLRTKGIAILGVWGWQECLRFVAKVAVGTPAAISCCRHFLGFRRCVFLLLKREV